MPTDPLGNVTHWAFKTKIIPSKTNLSFHTKCLCLCFAFSQTTKTRARPHERSIKTPHEYWINTPSITLIFSPHDSEGCLLLSLCRLCRRAFVCLHVCVPEYRVIFSMALPHKIFTWPSIMDCDLIEAECSHHVPSVNSPHKHQDFLFFIFWGEKLDPTSFRSPKQIDAGVKNMLPAFKASGIFLFFLFFLLVNIGKHLVNSANNTRFLKPAAVSFWMRELNTAFVCTVFKSTGTMPLGVFLDKKSRRSFSSEPYSLLNLTAKSQSNLDSRNPHIARQEAYRWPRVNTLAVPKSSKSLILFTMDQIYLAVVFLSLGSPLA